MATSQAEYLRRLFLENDYKWKINGQLQTPTEEDFDHAIDRAKELLYDEPVPSQLEVGRLIVRRWGEKKFDIYLQIGEANDD